MRWVWLVALALATSACEDPVLEAKADALGPEPGPYEEGPNHRAGQPCTYCHTRGGRAEPYFDLAGTVYARPGSAEPLEGVKVILFDSKGNTLAFDSNEAGNFFLGDGALPLEFPLWVRLEYQGEKTDMQTPIFRERSCSACHMDPPGPSRPGHIYLWEEP